MATPLVAAGAGTLAMPMVAVAIFFGSGAVDPPPPVGTVCTLVLDAAAGGTPAAPDTTQITGDQAQNARIIIAAAKALGMPQQAGVVGIMTAYQESKLLVLANPTVPDSLAYPHQGEGSDHDSIGTFQQRSSMGWGAVAQLMDPSYAATKFLETLAAVPRWPSLATWQAAQTVQRSADGTLYAQWEPLATAITSALWDDTNGTLQCTSPPGPGGGQLPSPNSAQAAVAIAYAKAQLGKPYVWGGNGPDGYDCSGLVQAAYATAGISLPRTTETQWSVGSPVPADQLQPGDLVFFNPGEQVAGLPGHVGIYLGDGRMIDAPHTGEFIRIEPVAGFGTYMGARRLAV